jgi:hypothetical protein
VLLELGVLLLELLLELLDGVELLELEPPLDPLPDTLGALPEEGVELELELPVLELPLLGLPVLELDELLLLDDELELEDELALDAGAGALPPLDEPLPLELDEPLPLLPLLLLEPELASCACAQLNGNSANATATTAAIKTRTPRASPHTKPRTKPPGKPTPLTNVTPLSSASSTLAFTIKTKPGL